MSLFIPITECDKPSRRYFQPPNAGNRLVATSNAIFRFCWSGVQSTSLVNIIIDDYDIETRMILYRRRRRPTRFGRTGS